jgi:PAS domain S-box-containing protein
MSDTPPLDVEVRCTKCKKLLAKNHHDDGLFEVKCSRCGTLNSVFEKMLEQVIITDAQGIILYTNDVVETITGYKPKEIIGNKPSLWGNQMPKKFYERMWDIIKNQKRSLQVAVKNKRKDGTTYHAELRISPILDNDNNVRFYIGIETITK